MSAKYTFLAWDTPVKTASLKLALLQLANNADDDGFSYYSISKMASSCGMSDRSFMRKIAELEDLKILKVERRANRPSLYTLIGDEMGVTLCHLQEAEVTDCHAEVTGCHLAGDRLSHDPNNTPNTSPKSIIKQVKFNEFDLENAKWMLLLIKKLNPNMKEPNIESWAKSIRDMRELDNRSVELIQQVFTWANNDSFWRVNILSPKKLRDKFDDLMVKMNNSGTTGSNGTTSLGDAGGDWHLPENRRIL